MRHVLILTLLFLTSCALAPEERASFSARTFDDLTNWSVDEHLDALKAFQLSCPRLSAKRTAWKDACAAAAHVAASDEAARAFFEENFVPYAVSSGQGDRGLFTGYYLPELRGSLRRFGKYQTPLYARPKDLVSADLSRFRPEWKGKRLWGKVHKGTFVPFDKRKDIAAKKLHNRAKPLVWVDDPVDAFFLEIQGSGVVRLTDGSSLLLGYDSVNGHPYTSLGRALLDRGELTRPVSMDSIRHYLVAHPETFQKTLNLNESYVFFQPLKGGNALGAMNIPLTPLRSLAVDPHFIPLGVPLWLDTEDGRGQPFQQLMIAQDTGGAIKGAVRGDVFWGPGKEAAQQAGNMQGQGRFYLLLPKALDPDAL